jgi:hypothetical protein
MPPRLSLNTDLTLGVNAPLMKFTNNNEIWSNSDNVWNLKTLLKRKLLDETTPLTRL